MPKMDTHLSHVQAEERGISSKTLNRAKSTMGVTWNTWFDAMIYMNRVEYYPLQTYLRFLILSDDILAAVGASEAAALRQVSQTTMRAAQVFVGAIPILCVYPFLQKYFAKGIVLGSVKG